MILVLKIILLIVLAVFVIKLFLLFSEKKSSISAHDSEKYFIFTKIPEKLKEIITPGHAYQAIGPPKNGKVKMSLDNDYAHWVDLDCVRGCPTDEIKERSSWNYKDVAYQKSNP